MTQANVKQNDNQPIGHESETELAPAELDAMAGGIVGGSVVTPNRGPF